MKDSCRIVVVGVGGQGVLFASKVISHAALLKGKNVVMSEVHGMAQRGGVVTCNVCIGDMRSPLVGDCEADVILGFEPVETYRSLAKANPDTRIITSTSPLVPVGVSIGLEKYPDVNLLFDEIKKVTKKLTPLDSASLALEVGSFITENAVLLGALAATAECPLEKEKILEALKSNVPQKAIEMNVKAFELGFNSVSNK
jgi:indolepyruvate ferredoxin oxidoreductase beta subunit